MASALQVLSGTNMAKQFKLVNRSLVYARFSITRRDSDVGAVFAFSPTSGIIPPDGEQAISVHFNPQVTGTYTNDQYVIKTPGGNTVSLECVGEAVGPQIELSKSLVNFGDVSIELPRRRPHHRPPALGLRRPCTLPPLRDIARRRPWRRGPPLQRHVSSSVLFATRRSVHRVFDILNHSELPTRYQLYDCEPNGVFTVQAADRTA